MTVEELEGQLAEVRVALSANSAAKYISFFFKFWISHLVGKNLSIPTHIQQLLLIFYTPWYSKDFRRTIGS